ncbi:MAG TPA: MazG nucleotide pyrophosphohydrolase domain-containing protein [Alphaproteobacteria bacterium]|nr:MazG nucleotide pyrophosphohydrolase domain-containing protein [Alphaproteobacteria bacterium]HQS93793.1 MazG nucleotide pyrophosphohydrolase domain-containing protein [Alphaproteobacteria bacterium]
MRKFPLDYSVKGTNPDLWEQVILQEKEAFDFGFYWETLAQLVEQVQSEADEIQEAFEEKDPRHLQEEIGDLIHASIGLSIFCGVDPKETIALSIQKFEKRFTCMKKIAEQDGHKNLEGQPLAVLMDYWEKSKKETAIRKEL